MRRSSSPWYQLDHCDLGSFGAPQVQSLRALELMITFAVGLNTPTMTTIPTAVAVAETSPRPRSSFILDRDDRLLSYHLYCLFLLSFRRGQEFRFCSRFATDCLDESFSNSIQKLRAEKCRLRCRPRTEHATRTIVWSKCLE